MSNVKLIPLEAYREVMTWLGFYPFENGTSQSKKWICIMFGWGVFFVNAAACVSSVIFFFKYVSIDLEESLYSAIQIFGVGGITCLMISSFLLRKTIFSIFQQLSEFYEIRKSEHFLCSIFEIEDFSLILFSTFQDSNGYSLQRLMHVNSRSEWIWSIYFKYGVGGFVPVALVTATISVIFCFTKNDHFESNNVYHLYRTM